jgi:hypothetical protein
MKRLIVLTMLIMLIGAGSAQALVPLECVTAADFNYRSYTWNTLCGWALQMDPGWNEDNNSWNWTAVDPSTFDDGNQHPNTLDALENTTYAVNTNAMTLAVTWYPLRS